MPDAMLETAQLAATFERFLRGAMRSEHVPSSEATERYLVQLLLDFVRPARRDLLDPPLGATLVEALCLPRGQRSERLRQVGDTTLFLAGLFLERLERTLVGPNYYVALGRTAYAHLARDCTDRALRTSFAELAERFADFTHVLSVLAERHLFDRDRDVVRLYRRWLITRSVRDAAALVRRGVIPWTPDHDDRH